MQQEFISTIPNIFKLPIQYIDHKTLDHNIMCDLELTCPSGETSIINPIYTNSKPFLQSIVSKYYTTNTTFLKQTQKLIKNYKHVPLLDTRDKFMERWVNFMNETSFKQKYGYIEWDHLDFCNRSSQIMQIMSVYNLSSPVISLALPVLFLIFPFILLRFVHKIPITFDSYRATLFENMKHNVIGQMIHEFSNSGNYDKKMYLVMGVGFYLFTIYQNALACVKFYNNIGRVKQMLFETKQHISHYINIHDAFTNQVKDKDSYGSFIDDSKTHYNTLVDLYHSLHYIKNGEFSFSQIINIGDLLSTLYELYDNVEYNKAITYSFGYLEYISYIQCLHTSYKTNIISPCKFSTKTTKLQDQYYIAHCNGDFTTNTITLDKNYIITGPNASGKTTLLKSTLLNILLSQQFGMGCYKSAKITPYNNVFCYLNIPDTSDRDSLFQAEARRCLDILHAVEEEQEDGLSLCIFDELYSGTNPEEASLAAKAYLKYLSTINIRFLLTTHYYDICDLDKTNKSIKNIHMQSYYDDSNTLQYSYTIKPGISHIKGGCQVLHQMNYPQAVLDHL